MRKRPKLTEVGFDRWAEELGEWIRESVSPFEPDTPEAQAARQDRARRDLLYFFQTYMPHYFSEEFAECHGEWADLTEIRDEAVFIAAPREHAKSTFFTLGVPVHDLCFKLRRFILIISDTNDQAAGFSLAIRIELEENPRLIHDFGEFRGRKWKENDFTTAGGVRVLARGRGERVRGMKNRQHRPDRVVVDDFENDKNVKNPKLVKEGLDWLKGAVMGSLAAGYSFTMIGNLFAPRSILSQFMAEEDEQGRVYISRLYAAIKPDGTPLWPALWPLERLTKKRRQIGTVIFNKEMLNKVGAEESPFKETWFVYIPEIIISKKWRVASFLDPSAKSGEANDYKAIITVGLNPDTMIFDVVHAWIRHASVNEMVAACYRIVGEYGGPLGVETNMFEDFLRQVFDSAARERGRHLPRREVRHTVEKEGRIIAALSPLVEFGKLRFVKGQSDQDRLIEQMIYILDHSVNDDGPDALEGAVSLLQGGSFGPAEYKTVTNRRFGGIRGAW